MKSSELKALGTILAILGLVSMFSGFVLCSFAVSEMLRYVVKTVSYTCILLSWKTSVQISLYLRIGALLVSVGLILGISSIELMYRAIEAREREVRNELL